MTTSGKIDRKALLDPGLARSLAKDHLVAPQAEIESVILAVWKDILETNAISTDDNFFDIGEHSLLLAKMQLALEAALSRPIAIIELFQYLTIQSLGAYLTEDHRRPPQQPNSPQERISNEQKSGRVRLRRRLNESSRSES